MANSKWVLVEWNGPQYSTMVQAGRALFEERGEWTYGLHVRGDQFVVLRKDAEADTRFIVLGPAKSPYEKADPEDTSLIADGETLVRTADEQQPPRGAELQAEANEELDEVVAKHEAEQPTAKKTKK